jgi:hypothetical protein
MAICVFCLEEKPPSKEHFIPAALGGKISVVDCVCEDDNNSFSGAFERDLFRELAPIRMLLRIPDREGDIPSASVVIQAEGKDYKGRIEDGRVVLEPVVEKVRQADGTVELTGKYLTEAIKANWDKQIKDGKWVALDPPADEGAVRGEVHLGGDLEICSSIQGFRNAAKIAFLGLTRHVGAKRVLEKEFNPIREFIMSGKGDGLVRLFVLEQFLQFVQLGPHQHSLVIAARRGEHRIDAIVRIFGAMCYFVNLSSSYDGIDLYHTFVYDAERGEENGVLQTVFDAEFQQIGDVLKNPETIWDDRVRWGQRFIEYLGAEIDRAAERQANSNSNMPKT